MVVLSNSMPMISQQEVVFCYIWNNFENNYCEPQQTRAVVLRDPSQVISQFPLFDDEVMLLAQLN